ncbi:protein SPA1-RELATED 2 isoform X2 [Carica papaya]|uniref:protein SPA1-RELATED 2 isoform X2 n=1 Tax=Carica papaya TaxID=3649 RepID=UPI000B8CB89B|nr:protein SPA1-RELATED 2 isoform X2 [Carica papaya]
MDGMDEGLGDEITSIDAVEGAHFRSKENEYSLKPENCNGVESQEMAARAEANSPESSFHVLADMLECKNLNENMDTVGTSENACIISHTVDDAGTIVEELTVKNYDGSNLALVGTLNNREKIQSRQNQWQHLYQLVGGSAGGSSLSDRDSNWAMPNVRQNVGYTSFPEFLSKKPSKVDNNEVLEQLMIGENHAVSSDILPHGGIRTKILSKSGFSEFFVKTALKGKGIICRAPSPNVFRADLGDQNNIKTAVGPNVTSNALVKGTGGPVVASNASLSLVAKTCNHSSCDIVSTRSSGFEHEGMTLRDWLKAEHNKASKAECLYIFKQIVDLLDDSHSQEVALHDLRPSSFKLLQANQVKYIGSCFQRGLSDGITEKNISHAEDRLTRRNPVEYVVSPSAKRPKFNESANFRKWPLFSRSGIKIETANDRDRNITGNFFSKSNECQTSAEHGLGRNSRSLQEPNAAAQLLTCKSEQLEEKWYASPEELNEGVCMISSNIYSLGVLLFELLGKFDSEREHTAAMSDLRHRILPPNLLSENPKEAGFCLWLLHPEPSSRPTTREILQSEVVNGFQEVFAEKMLSAIDQDDAESELLLHFLILLKEQKQKHTSKLVEDIKCLEADIEEVERRHGTEKPMVSSFLHNDSTTQMENGHFKSAMSSEALPHLFPTSSANEAQLMKNIHQLESAYLSMRSKIHLTENDTKIRSDRDLLRNRDNFYLTQVDGEIENPKDQVGAFFDGLCKYARYSKFEVRGVLRSAEFNNSANVICSLGFDRDEDYFAAAGVSKKIKIFEFNAIFNDSVDIHYPVIEISNASKLSCICWNNYIKNYLASTDYDGIVKLWDVSTGQAVLQYFEHEKRAWSVDFSQAYPTKLASGSDDCSVKLWNINEIT